MTVIAVTGGRDSTNVAWIRSRLDVMRDGMTFLAHGDARGTDRIAAAWADDAGVRHSGGTFAARWEALGRCAGHSRNQEIIDSVRPDALHAFFGGAGTADMVSRCRRSGVPIVHEAPTSPLTLIQESLRGDPWRMLVACVLLNLTSHRQVRPVLGPLFEMHPTPESMSASDPEAVADVIRVCGMQQRRAVGIRRMSQDFVIWRDSGFDGPVTELHGVGPYAADSWAIFQDMNVMGVEPNDAKLDGYVRWAHSEAIVGSGR